VPEGVWPESGQEEIVGKSPALKQVLASAERLALSDDAVLIAGEPGSGKESIARAMHRLSARRNESFVKIHCVTTAGQLLERELFGYGRGAFDAAISKNHWGAWTAFRLRWGNHPLSPDSTGRLKLANKGTLFLDELAQLPLDLQPKLVRVLKRGEFEPLGSTRTIRVNVRLIAATRYDLKNRVAENRLRQDLHDEFNTSSIHIPPLRERREDIPLLVRYFVQKLTHRMNKQIWTIPPQTMEALLNYDWPGNVRQLENFIERSVILTDGSILQAPLAEL
jgi:formate hydrogenlyase transcriptional activator